MHRRRFIKNTSLAAFAVGVFGNVTWSKDRFVGNSPTTTDILGPYYRPGAPRRININPSDYKGPLFHLEGTIYETDGKTPLKGEQVEIWQCNKNKIYDNTSDEYRYRGSQVTVADGKYHFITTHPVPYPTQSNPSINRPAHFHLRISGEGHQDLVTQVYFKDDPNIANDPSANSPDSIHRILEIRSNAKGEEVVKFDIVMSKEIKLVDFAYSKLAGIYKMSDESMMEFYKGGEALFWKWNGQIMEELIYRGENKFSGGIDNTIARFMLQLNGDVKVEFYHLNPASKKEYRLEGIRTFKY